MKRIFAAGCAALALLTSPVPAAPAKPRTITCPFLQAGSLKFNVPAKPNDMPEVDFDYPAKTTVFSFRNGSLLLVAMDEGEPSRLRVVVSAQFNKKRASYDGQIVVDMGGNQLMLHSGPVRCTVG